MQIENGIDLDLSGLSLDLDLDLETLRISPSCLTIDLELFPMQDIPQDYPKTVTSL